MTMAGLDYQRYLLTALTKIEDDRIDFLKSTSVFKSWTKASCRSFMSSVKTQDYRRGQRILT